MPTEASVQATRRDGREYVVQKFLSHRRDGNGTPSFKVKWADYEQPTWEPRKCVPEEPTSHFYRRLLCLEAPMALAGALSS